VTITGRSGQEVGEVLGLVAPHVHLEEAGVAVAPLAVLLDALGDGHSEVGDGGAGVGEAEFGVVDQVAGDGGRSPRSGWAAGKCGPSASVGLGDWWSSPVIYGNVMVSG
jgi:hypothetical protein